MVEFAFLGAAGEVTGSMHVLDTGDDKILLDCGMFQGRRKDAHDKNRRFPLAPEKISSMVLSHAHIDHSGRIPMLTRQGFTGRIITTRPTRDALDYMLLDSGHIQESDAQYLNYKSLRAFLYKAEQSRKKQTLSNRDKSKIKNLLKKTPYELDVASIEALQKEHGLDVVVPLYTMEDARQSLTYIDGYPFGTEVTIGKGTTVKFYVAGHILGSAFSLIKVKRPERTYRILYTGDVGRFDKPILRDPTLNFDEDDRDIDLLITESTYGDREHAPVADLGASMRQVLTRTVERGGTLIIPSFAVERLQSLMYQLWKLYRMNRIPNIPIFVDSPMGNNVLEVFEEFPSWHKLTLEEYHNMCNHISIVSSYAETWETIDDPRPKIVIAGSGMVTGGRVLTYIKQLGDLESTSILRREAASSTRSIALSGRERSEM